MAIEKKTILDRVEINRDGSMQMRFAKQILEDGKEIAVQWHRTAVEAGASIDDQMAAVNTHLQQMGIPAVAQAEIDTLKDYSQIAFTPEKVAAAEARKEEALVDILEVAQPK